MLPTKEIDMEYEAPAVTAITEVGSPLIGKPVGSGLENPQWNDEPTAS